LVTTIRTIRKSGNVSRLNEDIKHEQAGAEAMNEIMGRLNDGRRRH
jgi:hypothetical protein